jgi:F0F1-type ATP synthase membrane subunit c/vacuolar-type H+-ATPase subunit K
MPTHAGKPEGRWILPCLCTALLCLAFAGPAQAGFATKLMFQFDIGDARSLPWGDDWSHEQPEYQLAGLIADTEALLTPSTPIVVRLETLRRAVLYASRDRLIAHRLLMTFRERAKKNHLSVQPEPIAYLDEAFVNDLLWQVGEHSNEPLTSRSREVRGLVRQADGYNHLQKGLALHPRDPAYQFGAALLAGVTGLGSAAFGRHASQAIAAAADDPLLARNLDRIYANRVLTGA